MVYAAYTIGVGHDSGVNAQPGPHVVGDIGR